MTLHAFVTVFLTIYQRLPLPLERSGNFTLRSAGFYEIPFYVTLKHEVVYQATYSR